MAYTAQGLSLADIPDICGCPGEFNEWRVCWEDDAARGGVRGRSAFGTR